MNPALLEVNTRVWIKQFALENNLSGIADRFFEDLKSKGIEILWLMGIWKTSSALVKKYCFGSDLVPAYVKALNDWKKEDVIGSPFAIDDYILNPALGSQKDLLQFKERLNRNGIQLILDFIPNHFGADSPLLKSDPEIFLTTDKKSFDKDSYASFEYGTVNPIYVVHGRDPFFPPWSDTAQLNYFEPKTRELMTEKLLEIAQFADGVRCDMAMLTLNNVFQNTWMGVLDQAGYKKPGEEFWKTAIQRVKEKYPGFIFIAEVYWGLEPKLQQLGFDYTYDKTLLDRFSEGDVQGIKEHLHSDPEYQMKSVRFIENHDEERAASKLGRFKSLAAATVISTIPGVRLYYDGQFEGRKIKLPVQLGREPYEKPSPQIQNFYENLLLITRAEIFKTGNWRMLNPVPVYPANNSWENVLAWQWTLEKELRIVVVNFSPHTAQCRLRLDLKSDMTTVHLEDLLTKIVYERYLAEIKLPGLFIELKGYQSHIFAAML